MKSWPPSIPDPENFQPVLMHLKENVCYEILQKDSTPADRNLAGYMRSSNVGTRLIEDIDEPYKNELVVSFDTVTARKIRSKMLRVFSVSPDGDDIFVAPTTVTHAAANGVFQKEARILADELVSGFYEQFEIASMMGISKRELKKISPIRYEKQLHEIYESIRQRSLRVIESD